MKFFLGLAGYQCRSLAVIGLSVWSALLLIALMGEVAVGVSLAVIFSLSHLAALAAAVLPEVLSVAVSLGVIQTVLSLSEGGELAALRSVGARPLLVAAVLAVPVLPLLVLLSLSVNTTRPVALAALAADFTSPRGAAWTELDRLGVGVAAQPDGSTHLLLALGDDAIAVGGAGVTVEAGSVRLDDGFAERIAADGGRSRLRFDALTLLLSSTGLGLDVMTEKQLTTDFLHRAAVRWRRARLDWGGRSPAELVRRELSQRSLSLPVVVVTLLLGLGLIWRRRGLGVLTAYLLCAPLLLGVALFVPRWLA